MTVSASKVALVGSACRLPEARGLDEFWRVLTEGRCVITEIPDDRFGTDRHLHPNRGAEGRAVTFAAGVLDEPFSFDPFYFGISPREAAVMDPQQRVLLEVAVEALENAGIPPDSLAHAPVGVYVGASSLDYGTHAQLDPSVMEPQSMTGNTLSIIANRLSYIFDLRGPSYVVDTACSSSLIALHNAIEDIRSGKVETAIVGGVSILLHPIPFIGFSRASMLSENGLCRAFDASADGYVRSEGAVALVLRAEDVARANGEVIRGRFAASGINADGRTAGLSLPSMSAQAGLLATVYRGAELDPNRLAFVEAHGTGTRVGDPVEAEAIGQILAMHRDTPLLVGSAKTNFGHLEPASGLVGVLKAALALQNDVLPASLHFETPNPDIRFDALNLSVASGATPLDRGATPRLAGVNSFGFGGANAHVVLEDGDTVVPTPKASRSAPLVVSAVTAQGLKAMAQKSAEALTAHGDAADYANAAAYRRQRHAHRAVIAPGDVQAMADALRAVAEGENTDAAIVGEAITPAAAPVFVYSGNGSQWAGMGRDAYQGDTDFRLSFDRADKVFMSVAGWSLVTMMFSEDLETEIERTEIAQPLLFALQVALTEALARKGLAPSMVLGHSVGEVAAAWASGALSLADAVKVIHARSTHQEVTRHLGGMAALLLPADEAKAALEPYPGLELAAVNSGRSVTISGPADTLAEFAKTARKKRWALKRLDLDYPFHCALVEPIRDPLLASLADIKPREATTPMVSTVTGEVVEGQTLGGTYWWDNVRQPVRFSDGVTAALQDHRLFVEIGPRPVLTAYVSDIARNAEIRATALPSLKQNDTGADIVGNVVRRGIAHGAKVDEGVVFGPKQSGPDCLPTYPWQHAYYRQTDSIEKVRLSTPLDHVLLGSRLLPDQADWRTNLDTTRYPFLADHAVEESVVFPAAGFVEMFLAAGRLLHEGADIEVRDLDIVAALVLDAESEREVRTHEIAPNTFLISSRPRFSEDGWSPHAKARVGPAPAKPNARGVDGPERMDRSVSAPELYELTASYGLPYGPVFRRANHVTIAANGRAEVRLLPPDPVVAGHHFALDPTLFDSCFHALFAFIAGMDEGGSRAVLPVRLSRLTLSEGTGVPVRANLSVTMPAEGIVEADFALFDEAGAVVARADAVRFQSVTLSRDAGGETIVAEPALRRISRAGEAASVTPSVPAGLMATDDVEPDETALLIEAGVQAAAADTMATLFSEAISLDDLVARGDHASSAMPLVARLLMALEASGSAQEQDGRWTVGESAIDVSDVVALLMAEHPDRLAEAALIAALPQWLETVVESGLCEGTIPAADSLLAQLMGDAPFTAPLHEALLVASGEMLKVARDLPVRVGLVGAGNVALVRAFAELLDPARIALVVTDRNETAVERAKLLLERQPGLSFTPFDDLEDDGHPFDLLVMAPTMDSPQVGDIARQLKPDGVFLAAAHLPSLFSDAVFGLSAEWWAGSVDPQSPVGRLGRSHEWCEALGNAGLTVMKSGALASAHTDGLLVVAKSGEAAPAEERAKLPSLHAVGERARKVCDALAAMPDDGPEVLGLDTVPEGDCLIAIDPAEDEEGLADQLGAIGSFLLELGSEARTVTFVTFGAEGKTAKDIRPSAAAARSFARVAMNEFSHLAFHIIDIMPSFDASVAAVRLRAELAQPNDEREIVLASDHRSAVRYMSAPPAEKSEGDATTLAIPRRGSIDNLVWKAVAHPPLPQGHVRLKVDATGLNFRDVMWTLGLLPHEALQDGFAGPTLGMECSGTVEAIGEGVSDLSPGDAVIAFAPACFSSHVTVRSDAVVRRPDALGPEAAATIPVAFLTAFYALVELGRIEEGETVLIHGGAGGVGLAALQIAKWRGARVFATAGTTEKRALLTRLGADEVFDSRALTFADEALEATGGEGVDLVLNSLAGEAMERSLLALKPFGRFLELGKRDFYADTKLGLRPFRRNLSYFGIDADQLLSHRAKLGKRLLNDIMDLFRQEELAPLPYRAFAADAVQDAFRLMQHAGHIGKIVVAAPEPPRETAAAPSTTIHPDKTYLLVGGTSGFGFATAEWLIGQGARHLILASRSGVKDETIAGAIEVHRENGVTIAVEAVDVTDASALKTLVDGIDAAHPLAGVIHMAMVLDDALIASLDAERYRTVLGPKMGGVQALEAATRDVALDLFVVYSSITVQLGNPGQANYVAANAFLEGVARRRRAEGKPALAVAWGAIADVGVLARDMETSELLQRKLGRYAITAHEGLATLKTLLDAGAMTDGAAVRMIGKVDWGAARKDLAIARTPAFEDLADEASDMADAGASIDLAERLKGLSDQEALSEVTKLLAAEISRILKLPASEVDVHKPLTALGMDSLMGVELRMAAEQRLGIDIPLMSLAAGVTLTDLARKVIGRTRGEAGLMEDEVAETMITRHLGEGDNVENIHELEDAVRQKIGDMRTIIP
ncbi:MAG: SDR family NAD(P)-dependent oxidoreductase [Devosia sp.]